MTKLKSLDNKSNSNTEFRGKRLRELRDKLELTQPEFAILIEINKDTISRIELGKIKLTDHKIAHIIVNLSPEKITERIERDKPDKELIEIVRKLTIDKNISQIIEELGLDKKFFDKPKLVENYLGNLEQHSFEELRKYTEEYIKQIKEITRYFTDNKQILVYSIAQKRFLEKDFVRLTLHKKDIPHRPTPILLNVSENSNEDSQDDYWFNEFDHLNRQLAECIEDIKESNNTSTLNVFALAPQPLVVELGRRLKDISNIEILPPYRINNYAVSWGYREVFLKTDYLIEEAETIKNKVALNLSLSTSIMKQTIKQVLKEEVSIWELTIEKTDDEFLKSKNQLTDFRDKFRETLNRINENAKCSLLHVFLSVPIPIAFEIGREWNPVSDPALRLYGISSESGYYSPMHTISKY